jgi:hypothetical protein
MDDNWLDWPVVFRTADFRPILQVRAGDIADFDLPGTVVTVAEILASGLDGKFPELGAYIAGMPEDAIVLVD